MSKKIEVEKKYILTMPAEQFIQQLTGLGFSCTNLEHETDTYYSRPDVDYMKTVECLRIRQRNDYAEMTYKPPTKAASDVTAKHETNVRLDSPEHATQAQQLFDTMGMVELVKVEKTRSVYQYDDEPLLSVCVDDVAHAGMFVEIEVMSADEASARKQLQAVETKLGLDVAPAVRLPYRDLVLNALEASRNG